VLRILKSLNIYLLLILWHLSDLVFAVLQCSEKLQFWLYYIFIYNQPNSNPDFSNFDNFVDLISFQLLIIDVWRNHEETVIAVLLSLLDLG